MFSRVSVIKRKIGTAGQSNNDDEEWLGESAIKSFSGQKTMNWEMKRKGEGRRQKRG
jgi:hypothetical protein